MKRRLLILKKTLALVLVISMSMSVLGVLAFAADGDPVISGSGTQEDPKITVIVTESSEGNRNSVSTETVTEWTDVDEDGYGTTFEETETETHVTVEEGRPLYDETASQGSEIICTEQVDITSTITMILIEDGKSLAGVEGTSDSAGTTETDNLDHIGGSTNRYYDYTTTTETDRSAAASVSDVNTHYGHNGEDYELPEDMEVGMTPIQPQWTGEEKDANLSSKAYNAAGEAPAGMSLYLSGEGEDSNCNAAAAVYVDGVHKGTLVCDVSTFELTDSNGVVHTTYCVDMETDPHGGWWYHVENLEDADYYTPEEAKHIRAITLNGYWGTEPTDNNPAPLGSLAALKALLRSAGYENTGLTDEDIDALSEGEACTATQMAIWQYGNHSQYGDDYQIRAYTSSTAKNNRIDKVYAYLAGLSMTEEEAGTTQIITEEKFIDNMGLTIGDKVDGHENNADDDNTNDAYNVDLMFSLVVQPSTENDDLIVKVVDSEGNVVKTARLAGDDSSTNYGTIVPDENGNYTISGLQLVEGSDVNFDITLEGTQYLRQGVYIYSSEIRNSAQSQTMVGIVEGYQEVDVSMDVTLSFEVDEATITTERVWSTSSRTDYVYTEEPEPTPEPDPEPSPEPSPEPDPTPTPDPEIPEETPPIIDIPDEPVPIVPSTPVVPTPVPGVPVVDIPDDDVPLDPVPETGDVSGLWIALSLLSGGGLAGLSVLNKKNGRKDEEK